MTIHAFAPLAVLAESSSSVRRNGRVTKFYTELSSVTQSHTSDLVAALQDLVVQGARVQVREEDRVYTLSLVDGALVWNPRQTPKHRTRVSLVVAL